MHFAKVGVGTRSPPGPAFPAWLSPDGHLRGQADGGLGSLDAAGAGTLFGRQPSRKLSIVTGGSPRRPRLTGRGQAHRLCLSQTAPVDPKIRSRPGRIGVALHQHGTPINIAPKASWCDDPTTNPPLIRNLWVDVLIVVRYLSIENRTSGSRSTDPCRSLSRTNPHARPRTSPARAPIE